jgi:hypothetical protein
MNRSIVDGLKARLGRYEDAWVDELPSVLWAIRSTEKTSHGKTPFSLTFGSKAVIPAEEGITSPRKDQFSSGNNDKEVLMNLNILEERREEARFRKARYKLQLEKYYNARVKHKWYKPRDLVLRRNEASRQGLSGKDHIKLLRYIRQDHTS